MAEKREGVSERIWRCVTWIWVPMSSLMDVAWKSLLTDCHCGGGSQLVDTTMVYPLSRDGVAQRGSATTDRKSLARARRRKERTYPELTGEHGRARLVVLGVEVGGRWSAETSVFLRSLEAAKARGAPPWLGEQVRAAWLRRWQGLLGCAAARSFGCSLLDGPVASGADGAIPSMNTVLSEARYA